MTVDFYNEYESRILVVLNAIWVLYFCFSICLIRRNHGIYEKTHKYNE